MSEHIKRINFELTRTEEIIRNRLRVYGFSSDIIKIELSEETYRELSKGWEKINGRPETLFGINFEVKDNLKRDFIIYIDSFNIN